MGQFRLIAVMTFPLNDESETKALTKKVTESFKGIHPKGKVYFRQDMVDDTDTPPDEAR